jgi:hypothetical protein
MLETTVVKLGRIYKSLKTNEYIVPTEFINIIEAQFVKYNVIETGNYAIMKLGEFITRWRLMEDSFWE